MQAWDLQLYLQFNIEHYNATVVKYFIADISNDKDDDDKDFFFIFVAAPGGVQGYVFIGL